MRTMPLELFAFFMLIPLAMPALGIGIAVWPKCVARTMRRQRPVEVSALEPGYGVVWGHVAEGDVRAPLSGRRCAWYEAWVEELRPSARSSSAGTGETVAGFRRIFNAASSQPIRITDGKTACLVMPEGARVHETAWSAWEGQSERPARGAGEPALNAGSYSAPALRVTATASSVFGSSPVRYRYVERYIMACDPIFVMGQGGTAAQPGRGRRSAGTRSGASADRQAGRSAAFRDFDAGSF
ncbi:hypothetical protein [Elioraea sp.]|uniref:hypothetical protein n=1 Tax=Elioraea sp. TaxID=2185103 RepID=UPI00307EB379